MLSKFSTMLHKNHTNYQSSADMRFVKNKNIENGHKNKNYKDTQKGLERNLKSPQMYSKQALKEFINISVYEMSFQISVFAFIFFAPLINCDLPFP